MRLDTRELSLDGLRRDIGGLPPASSDTTIASNLALIGRLGRPASVVALLEQLLEEDDALAQIAARSYRHVNHFDKIVLVDSERKSDYRLTLHLWQPPYTEEELNEELIHDHRFSFWSTVLAGTLRSESFQGSDTGRIYRQYEYVPERRTKTNLYTFVGEASLRSNGTAEEHAGGSYYLPYETIHRVELPRQDITCTLVLRGPRERDNSNIFNTSYPQTDTRVTNRPFSPRQLAAKLASLAEAVSIRARAGQGAP